MVKYNEEFKRQVVEEYLSGKGSFETVSSRFSLDRSMLRSWVAGYQQHGQAGLGRKRTDYDTDFKQQVLQRMRQEGCRYGRLWRYSTFERQGP